MDKIPSFTINHNLLLRGIYVSRKDTIGGDTVTTFDIRMKEPNREPALHPGALHTIEHLAATYLRNDPEWKDSIVYWGPMGCLTGNYLLMKGDLQPKDIVDLMRRTFRFVADFEGDIQELHLRIVATGCCTTCQWLAGRHASIATRCSTASRKKIWCILQTTKIHLII